MDNFTTCIEELYHTESQYNNNYTQNILSLLLLKHRLISNIDEAVNLDEIERLAFRKLNLSSLSYYTTGAADEVTLNRNKNIFSKVVLLPRVLRDVTITDTRTTVLGTTIAFPVMIAPTALHKLCHPEGEVATAKAAKEAGTLICLSSFASSTLQEVARAGGYAPRWFQLYVKTDRSLTMKVIQIAEKFGYTAVVVTVDAPVLGLREKDFIIRFAVPSAFTTKKSENKEKNEASKREQLGFYGSNIDMSLTWDFLNWLRSFTKLKILIKGIHRVDDALKAQEMGIDGIIISNHGGRQLDTVPSRLEMLIPVAKALKKIANNKMEIYLDGGIRRGTDIIKALAFGAQAVFIGRPSLWGLACAGEKGVKQVLDMLKTEMIIAMKLLGCKSVNEITDDLVAFKSKF